MKTQIGITETNRQKVNSPSIKVVAEVNLQNLKIKNTHRNDDSESLFGKHKFLESHLQQLDEIIDNLA